MEASAKRKANATVNPSDVVEVLAIVKDDPMEVSGGV